MNLGFKLFLFNPKSIERSSSKNQNVGNILIRDFRRSQSKTTTEMKSTQPSLMSIIKYYVLISIIDLELSLPQEKSLKFVAPDWLIFPHIFDCSAKRELIIVYSECMSHSEI